MDEVMLFVLESVYLDSSVILGVVELHKHHKLYHFNLYRYVAHSFRWSFYINLLFTILSISVDYIELVALFLNFPLKSNYYPP